MSNTPAISVIIPMYNAEKYIAECLESILIQTLQDFEVIVVNDCSTDSCRQIAESYLEKFSGRLKIYDNEKNSGAGAARNHGLRRASGEYIYFMDADDLILTDGLERLYRIAKTFDVDFVNLTKSYEMSDDGKSLSPVHLRLTRLINEPILENNLEWRVKALLKYHYTIWAPWRRLIRRKFLIENEIFFPENLIISEDRLWTYCLLFYAKKIIHVPMAITLYRLSETSITKSERTPLQRINLGINTVIQGIEWINNVMDKVPFFSENPQYRYAVLENATKIFFSLIAKKTQEVSPSDIVKKNIKNVKY